jgi:hypothetical protein
MKLIELEKDPRVGRVEVEGGLQLNECSFAIAALVERRQREIAPDRWKPRIDSLRAFPCLNRPGDGSTFNK